MNFRLHCFVKVQEEQEKNLKQVKNMPLRKIFIHLSIIWYQEQRDFTLLPIN